MPIRQVKRTYVPVSPPPTFGSPALPVPLIKQEQLQWCWAACTDMTLEFYGKATPKQCDFANWLYSQTACCTNGSSSQCDKPCTALDVGKVYTHWGIKSTYVGSLVSFATLAAEINAGRPVEVGWSRGASGHVILVVDASITASTQMVRINDPVGKAGAATYDELLTAFGQGSWIVTWTGISQ